MRIGGKEYDAEVVVGYDADGNMRLYDFVRMTRTDEKKTDEPFEGNTSRDSRADLSNVRVSENGAYVKQISGEAGKPVAEIIRGGAKKFSLSNWTEKTDVRESLIAAGYEAERVDKWIGDVDGVAATTERPMSICPSRTIFIPARLASSSITGIRPVLLLPKCSRCGSSNMR